MPEEKKPHEILIMRARVAAGASWGSEDEKEVRRILRDCANMIAALHRDANGFAETIDGVREALGQKTTHYMIVAQDVGELVAAVRECGERCPGAMKLKQLAEE